jgi:predicted transcriptional regulator
LISITTIKPELENQNSKERTFDMARPPAKELTERELEVMHVFWNRSESTVAEVREVLAANGLDRAYTTVATLVRILADKGYLVQTNQERPFSFRPERSYEDVSRKLLGELLDRVFRGSREQLLVRLMEQKALTPKERALLGDVLRQEEKRR